jgi:hypothetical protein
MSWFKLLSARYLCTVVACIVWGVLTWKNVIPMEAQVLLINTIVLSYFNRGDRNVGAPAAS